MNISKYVFPVAVGAALICTSGCVTRSQVIPSGATAEVVAGFSQDDINYVVSQAIQNVDSYSQRYHQGQGRRIINVKPIVIDTLTTGAKVNSMAVELDMGIKEKLMNHGSFIIYNELMANQVVASGGTPALPEFLLMGTLTQRNMRLDNGDVYQEFSLNLTMTCTPYHPNPAVRGLEIWQKRIPLRKLVDGGNAL